MTKEELEELNNDIIAVIDHYIGLVGEFALAVKPDATIYEVRGMAMTALFDALQDYENKNIKQTLRNSEVESSEADGVGPGEVQENGSQGGQSEGPEGNGENATGEAPGADKA